MRDLVMGEVRQKFRPEFLNRLDDIILFHRLQRSEMGKIVDIQMQRLRQAAGRSQDHARAGRCRRARGSPTAATIPAYGARPVKRVIQRHVQDPLAEQILAGRIKDGDTVRISVRDGELVLNGEPVKVAA